MDQVRPGGTWVEKVPFVAFGVIAAAAVWLVVAQAVRWFSGRGFDVMDVASSAAETSGRPWLVLGVLAGVFSVVGWLARRVWVRGAPERTRRRYRDLPGLALRDRVQAVAGERVVLRESVVLRPGLVKPSIKQVAYKVGNHEGRAVWKGVRETEVVIGPPGSGKGFYVVVNRILDSIGACVTTSTRPDNLAITMAARAKVGPVFVFDPEGLAAGIAPGKKWSPIRGCKDTLVAATRADALVKAGYAATGENQMWADLAQGVMRCLLHAAALEGASSERLREWSVSPSRASEALRILESHPEAAPGWDRELQDVLESPDPRTQNSVWIGVRQCLASLAHPSILAAVSPAPGEEFDTWEFLRSGGTFYLLGTAQGAVTTSPLVAALAEDIVLTAKSLAGASQGSRLDPPLSLVLDEAANYPLPSIDSLMSDGGGTGINTTAVFQSLAQMRKVWDDDRQKAIMDSAGVKLILGGSFDSDALRDISSLTGERDEITHSANRDSPLAILPSSFGESVRRVPILQPNQVREIPFGMGLLLLRAAPPAVIDLDPWITRPDAAELRQARTVAEETIRVAHAARHLTHLPE